MHLENGMIKMPRQPSPIPISIVKLKEVVARGLLSRDINGKPPRGAFSIRPIETNEIPTYPALWNHTAKRERSLIVHPDKCGTVNVGMEKKLRTSGKKLLPSFIGI